MIIDAHVTLGKRFTGEEACLSDYMVQMRKHNIGATLICPMKPRSGAIREANDLVAEMTVDSDLKLFRAFRINPWDMEEFHSEMEMRTRRRKFIAAYMNPWEETFRCNDERIMPVYASLAAKRLPLVIETGFPWVSHISQLWEVARMFPGLKILATNAGQLDLSGLSFGGVKAVIAESPNLYLGTSAAVGADWLKGAAEYWARGRILFTSSYPVFEPEIECFRIDHGYMSEKTKKDIYYNNAAGFLGI